jgi:hypothetical protein
MNVLSLERRAAVVSDLTDCGSVRATSRQTGVHKTTILSLILKLGEGCQRLHNRMVRGLHVGRVEADEMHAYIHTREQNLGRNAAPEHGETWLYLAVASTAKLIVSYHVGDARATRPTATCSSATYAAGSRRPRCSTLTPPRRID